MRMRFAAPTLLLTAGCATMRPAPKGPLVGYLGAEVCPAPAGISVMKVAPDSAATEAGIQAGDTLVAIDGIDLAKPENRPRFLAEVRSAARPVGLSLERGGQRLDVTAKPKMAPPYLLGGLLDALLGEVIKGRTVAVALVVDQVNYTNSSAGSNQESFKAATRTSLENRGEALLLKVAARGCGNYHVVDRGKTSEILAELKFQMTGAVSSGTVKQIGQLTGATHLVFESYTRYQRGGALHEQINMRLVEVESGDVLSTDRWEGTVALR